MNNDDVNVTNLISFNGTSLLPREPCLIDYIDDNRWVAFVAAILMMSVFVVAVLTLIGRVMYRPRRQPIGTI